MKKAFIGIDPGKNSYITVIVHESGEIIPHAIPMVNDEVDTLGLDRLIKIICSDYDEIKCVIEDVHALFGSSASNTFSFGRTVGILEGLLVANHISFTAIQPKKWQSEMWQGVPIKKRASSTGKTQVNDTKAISLMAAQRLFPNMDFRPNGCTERCRKPDHNKVDSILIAEYCRRKFN